MWPLFIFLVNDLESRGTNYPGGMAGLLLSQGGGKDRLMTYTGGLGTGLLFTRGGGKAAGLSPAQQPSNTEVRISIGISL